MPIQKSTKWPKIDEFEKIWDAGLIILVISLILKMYLGGTTRKFHPVRLSLLLSAFLTINASWAQESLINTLDLYSPQSPANCTFTTVGQGEFLWIYAQLDFDQPVEDSLWINYNWESSGLLYEDSTLFRSADKRRLRIKWEFAAHEVPTILTVSFSWKARDWVFQEHFPMDVFHPSGGISLWESKTPWFQHWMHVSDSILIQNNSSEVTYAYYYRHSFDPARPPMAMRPGPGDSSLSIDSIFTVPLNQYFTPTKEGLYFFQSDSSSTSGRSILVKNEHFPQPKEINQLTQPLIYITTRVEYLKLKKDLTDKQALDKFWLSTLGSPEKARTAIKAFYQNIETSNTLFSSYKEGWKTDRGLIYTVLGPPLSVSKKIDGETWTYRAAGGSELIFSFLKIKNIFSNNHYELIRDQSYDRDWFQAIDRWREGRIN